jgi:LmbE family N-acetylglucosaminyl deacetylase
MAFRKVLLAVLAHPDHETFGIGGHWYSMQNGEWMYI